MTGGVSSKPTARPAALRTTMLVASGVDGRVPFAVISFDCAELFCGVCAITTSLVKNTAAQRKTVLAGVVMLVTCRDLKSGGPHLLLMRMLGRSSDAATAAAGPST